MNSIGVGDTVYIKQFSPKYDGEAGKIVAITDEPGKQIGLELHKPVGYHTCDGLITKIDIDPATHSKYSYGIWVQLDQIELEGERTSRLAAEEAIKKAAVTEAAKSYVIKIDEAGRKTIVEKPSDEN